jgi:hypothetical protein
MISIKTVGDTRIYTAPRALWDIAHALFPNVDSRDAFFSLAGKLSANDLHTLENVALNVGHSQALQYATKRLANRASGKAAQAQLN